MISLQNMCVCCWLIKSDIKHDAWCTQHQNTVNLAYITIFFLFCTMIKELLYGSFVECTAHINPHSHNFFRAWISHLLVTCLKWCFAGSNSSQTTCIYVLHLSECKWKKVMSECYIAWVVCHVLRHCSALILDFFTLEDEGTTVQYFKTSGTTRPVAQTNIPEHLNFWKYCCDNLKYHKYYPPLCYVIE